MFFSLSLTPFTNKKAKEMKAIRFFTPSVYTDAQEKNIDYTKLSDLNSHINDIKQEIKLYKERSIQVELVKMSPGSNIHRCKF